MSALPIDTVLQRKNFGSGGLLARRVYNIAARDPFHLPEEKIELPPPPPSPGPPPTINWISAFLPPIVILMVFLVMFFAIRDQSGTTSVFMLLMPMMSLAFPIGNLINYFYQKKAYTRKMVEREQTYRAALGKVRQRLDGLAQQQRAVMEKEYPLLSKVISIALGKGSQRRLWWRRKADSDFLFLRAGTGMGKPSFSVAPPRISDPNDPLDALVRDVIASYNELPSLPVLIELPRVGSLAVISKSGSREYGLVRRLVLDVLVHHSPQDVQVVVLADSKPAQSRWEWLKWAPHTRAIRAQEHNHWMAFDSFSIDKCLEWLYGEFESRRNPEIRRRRKNTEETAIVVILDDTGTIRNSPEVRELAASGHEYQIYLLFAGGQHWPRECRARIEVANSEFLYTEYWAGEKDGLRIKGDYDSANQPDCERVARALARLDLPDSKGSMELPESVRLYDLLGEQEVTPENITRHWQRTLEDKDLLQFSFGFRRGRKGLEAVELNLLPEDLNGLGAYHTILVGTTGSGKSEFMKSLVLSAAYRYPPAVLNFFFMDFKGGAAFNVMKDLPHVVGVVTNLSPQLVERGLSALRAEIDRRQKKFADEAAPNIWSYNLKRVDQPMPHLMLLLDEFARGMEEFPSLPELLDLLVRQGRSLGIYLLLANQDVNAAVDKLLNNAGWRIALKVARQEEMHIIDRNLPVPKRPGQGYLLAINGTPQEFQAAYAGFTVADSQEKAEQAFKIFEIGPDGKRQLLYSAARRSRALKQDSYRQSEQDDLIAKMTVAAQSVEAARPIYLDPLDEHIPLEAVFQESAVQRVFDGQWQAAGPIENRLLVPVGFQDSPQECVQKEMEVDFDDQDGHLWIVGAAGSGKAMTLETILLSLALTHTPEQVWFYILEFGAGRLLHFESLPHCGAVISSTDSVERLDKLLKFLDQEMDRRITRSNKSTPAIFLIINNFAEMRANYPDHAERVSRYARDGKAVGLHLIITTNRGLELSRIVIARRIVLQLAKRDEYMDVIGRVVSLPSIHAEGRGLWVERQTLECQIAQPQVQLAGQEDLQDIYTICEAMRTTWKGPKARPIRVLPEFIPFEEVMGELRARGKKSNLPIPVGVSFESLELVAPQMLREIPRWLVIGPPRSGKSNFLGVLARAVLAQAQDDWELYYFSLRRSPPKWIADQQMRVLNSLEASVQTCMALMKKVQETSGQEKGLKKTLLLLDDLGAAFEPGKESLAKALNDLALAISARDDFFIVAAGAADELRSQQVMSPLVRSLKQARTGVGFSKDPNDMDMLGTPVSLQYRRIDLPPGRGFWVSAGKSVLVQTPCLERDELE